VFPPSIAPELRERVHTVALRRLAAELEYNASVLQSLRYSTAPSLRDEAKQEAAEVELEFSDELRTRLDAVYMKIRSAKAIHQSIQSAIGNATPELLQIEAILSEVRSDLPTIIQALKTQLVTPTST
jgi:hypothetical protein